MAYEYPVGKFGRKDEFWLTEDGLLLIAGWRRDGLTMEQVAKNMDISCDTLYKWRAKYDKIADALKISKEVADTQVTNSLFKRANGFTSVDVTEELVEGRLVVTKRITKTAPPDVTACLAWLNNRRPDLWRQKQAEIDTTEKEILAASQVLISIKKAVDESNGQN